MTLPGRILASDYMHYAKFDTSVRFNLASSGVLDCVLSDLGLLWDDLALHGPNAGGFAPLIERVATRFGVEPRCVVMPGGGASFANHLALATIVSPGDRVLIEHPTYELLVSTLGYLQAEIVSFQRAASDRWRLDPDRVISALTPRTRLIVLTNLHNPTSAFADDVALDAIAEAAERVGAMVLVDEVYRELMFRDGVVRTAYKPAPNIVVTSSLTKAYGLSGLRCSWILAPAALAERIRRLNDLYAVQPPHIAERMSVVAFDRLDELRARANALIDQNRAAYRQLLGDHPKLDQTIFDTGTTVFPRLLTGEVDGFTSRLKVDFETGIVPGRFFDMPSHMRIGLGGDPATTRQGLERLAEALG